MRSRVVATLAVVCLSAFLVAGCGDDSEGASGGNSTKELKSTANESSGSGSDSSSDSSDSSDDSDVSIPGLDELQEELGDGTIPDFGDFGELGDCMTQATAYASLAMSALGGGDAAAAADKALEQMKEGLPADLHDDIEVLGAAYKTVAEEGFIEGGEAMETPEFEKADAAISAYFEETCGG